MDEYIIINKTALEKRIEELKKPIAHYDGIYVSNEQMAKQDILEDILSQSIPLIPEIEKAFYEGKGVGIISYQPKGHTLDMELYNERKQDYISNLKLDI